jgi:broad specificity phosphatase PhoE
MPARLVFVRHGESEANVINRALRRNEIADYPPQYLTTPDREIRLSRQGAEQADKTGRWLAGEYPQGFDLIYVSDHTRAKETAARICLAAGWEAVSIRIDPLLGERSWGEFDRLSPEERAALLARHRIDPLHTPMPHGETLLATRDRSRHLLERAAREMSGKRVLVISHGEFIEAIWAEIAHMNTEYQVGFFADAKRKIANCQVVEFSTRDSSQENESPRLQTVRSSTPHREQFGGWEVIERVTYSPEQLLAQAERYPRLQFP